MVIFDDMVNIKSFITLFPHTELAALSLTALLRAIATNQTLVWQYQNEQDNTCRRSESCQETCHAYFRIEPWVAHLDDWKTQHGGTVSSDATTFPIETQPLGPDAISSLLKDADVKWDFEKPLIDMLYDQGTDFLHGMILEKALSVRAPIIEPVQSLQPTDPIAFSVAVVEGPSTPTCLADNLPDHQPCQLFVVQSPHNSSIDYSPMNCTVSWVDPVEDPALQFFQALHFVSDRAHSAFVGPDYTAESRLVRQRMTFKTYQNAWMGGRVPPILPIFISCP